MAATVNGYTTAFGYDTMGRVSQITPPADTPTWNPTTILFEQVNASEYGLAAGHWRQTVSTGNARTVTYYDALWRPVLTRSYDALDEGNTRSIVLRRFDEEGRATFASYPARSIVAITDTLAGTTTQYDALGRPAVIQANSELGVLTTTNYFDPQFKTRQVNPRGFTTTTSYLAWDQPDTSTISSIVAPEGVTVTINRDALGKSRSVTRSGGGVSATRSYVYDGYQLPCKTVEPESGATIQALDAANNLAWSASGQTFTSTTVCDTGSVTAAAKTSFTYDARNRLRNTTFGDGSSAITRTLTPDGLLSTIASNGTTWTYGYNKLRSVTSENLVHNSQSYNINRLYDTNGSLSVLKYPADGTSFSVDFAPNALGQPSKAGVYASTVRYHPNGAVASYTLGNGKAHTLSQNTRGLPLLNTDTGVLQDSYTYDANANVASITDAINSKNRTLGYDALDRLTSATAPSLWGTGTFSYNALDNLTTSVVGTRNSTHTYDANNRLQTINSNGVYTGYSYDAQGNTTAKGTQGYYFDQGKRLILANGVAAYTYDGLGRRVYASATPTINNKTTVYSQAGEMLYSTLQVSGGSSYNRYVYLGGKLIAEDGSAGVIYNHTDALGSPIARSSSAGALVSNTWYEPYGKTTAGTNPATVGYTGHVNDVDTGLIYMQQRYYEPVSGRFLSTDAVKTGRDSGSSFNRYVYALNNPYRYVDPDGRAIETAWDIISFAASVAQFRAAPSVGNGLAVAYDGFAVAVPFLPGGIGAIRQIGNVGEAMARGRQSETRVLNELGEAKNTAAVGEAGKKSIPDFQNTKVVGEIKDTQRVTDSSQLRTQREHAAATDREHVVVTGTETKVSKTVEQNSTVIRRDDLGPKVMEPK